jgi:hypothetical protein
VLAASFALNYFTDEKPDRSGVAIPEVAMARLQASPGEVLVIADGQTFLELDHYLDEPTASRMVFTIDRESALRYMETDCYDRALPIFQHWFPTRGRLIAWDRLPPRPFLVYGLRSPMQWWLMKRLGDEGAVITQKSTIGKRALWEVQ